MLYIILGILVVIVSALFWLVFSMKKNINDPREDEKTRAIFENLAAISEQNRSLSEQNRELRHTIDAKLSETHRATQDQLGQTMRAAQGIASQSVKSISEITEKLTKLEETNKQVMSISSELLSLQDILKNPKQRGILGEYYLEEILKNVLPPNSYQMQFNFKDGVIVDAAIFIKDKIIPIDSKFSLENYEKIINSKDPEERVRLEKLFKQDLKERIDETAKYIKPDENTMDFAFMFIPSEAIYYDLLVNKVGAVQVNTRDLVEYANRDKRVIIVSPTSFHAYLQTVLQGLRMSQIEESAKTIRIHVEKLHKHTLAYTEYFNKVGTSLGTTVNHYNAAHKELEKVEKDVTRITGGERLIEPVILEKPREE